MAQQIGEITHENKHNALISLRQKYQVNVKEFDDRSLFTKLYNDEETKLLYVSFIDKGEIAENKFLTYEKIFTYSDLKNIKTDAGFSTISVENFVQLIKNCLLAKDTLTNYIHFVVETGNKIKVTIVYAPDGLWSVRFCLVFPVKKMNEIDLLKLRLQEAENKIKELQSPLDLQKYTKWVEQIEFTNVELQMFSIAVLLAAIVYFNVLQYIYL
eukprot:238384_1